LSYSPICHQYYSNPETLFAICHLFKQLGHKPELISARPA